MLVNKEVDAESFAMKRAKEAIDDKIKVLFLPFEQINIFNLKFKQKQIIFLL